jgi:hypothetical protein
MRASRVKPGMVVKDDGSWKVVAEVSRVSYWAVATFTDGSHVEWRPLARDVEVAKLTDAQRRVLGLADDGRVFRVRTIADIECGLPWAWRSDAVEHSPRQETFEAIKGFGLIAPIRAQPNGTLETWEPSLSGRALLDLLGGGDDD